MQVRPWNLVLMITEKRAVGEKANLQGAYCVRG